MMDTLTRLTKGLVVLGLILSLGVRVGASAEEHDREEPFPRHSSPVGGRTEIDPYDPYAPGPLTETVTDGPVVVLGVFLAPTSRGVMTPDQWVDQCRPGVCRAW